MKIQKLHGKAWTALTFMVSFRRSLDVAPHYDTHVGVSHGHQRPVNHEQHLAHDQQRAHVRLHVHHQQVRRQDDQTVTVPTFWNRGGARDSLVVSRRMSSMMLKEAVKPGMLRDQTSLAAMKGTTFSEK